jgi:tRNA threonylcarbamoyladenosine biosynthesis protein TsaE
MAMREVTFQVTSEDQTQEIAQAIAPKIQKGTVLRLQGPLGAGKTTFVRALVEALGGDVMQVSSPTFSIIHHYDANLPIAHVDAYRMESDAEARQAGIEELFDGEQAVLIEWPEKIEALIPGNAAKLEIRWLGENEREMVFTENAS